MAAISKYDEYMGIAVAVSKAAKCLKSEVGAVIVDQRGHIVGTGRNGSPPGDLECTDGHCPRAFSGVAPGSSYDTGPGQCIAVHAEANALLNRTVASVAGCTVYVTRQPCDGCVKLIRAARIRQVFWPEGDYLFA